MQDAQVFQSGSESDVEHADAGTQAERIEDGITHITTPADGCCCFLVSPDARCAHVRGDVRGYSVCCDAASIDVRRRTGKTQIRKRARPVTCRMRSALARLKTVRPVPCRRIWLSVRFAITIWRPVWIEFDRYDARLFWAIYRDYGRFL